MKSHSRLLAFFLVLALAGAASAAPTYLALYIQSHRIGYASYATTAVRYKSQSAQRSDTRTLMDMGLLGTPLKIEIDSTSYLTKAGKPLQMLFTMSSQGRTQKLDAKFGPRSVTVAVDNSGERSVRVLPLPAGPVVDDPLTLVLNGKTQHSSFYILDPTTVSFIQNTVRVQGQVVKKIAGKEVHARLVIIHDPRADTKVFIDANGNVLLAEGPMGIEMLPVSRSEALSTPSKYSPTVDLAFATSIKTDKPIRNSTDLRSLEIKISGHDLADLPSDDHQTVTKQGASWLIDVHPPLLGKGVSISDARKQKAQWVTPDVDMPSDKGTFIALSKKIVGAHNRVIPASLAIKEWVYDKMQPDAGIGVLRDATEVLRTKKGVCRDYAILTGTLLRAAGIPTRLATGLEYWNGSFYYHAWDEVWDGKHWVGIDSTVPEAQISAAHVELAVGRLDSAFTFNFLNKVKLNVLHAR